MTDRPANGPPDAVQDPGNGRSVLLLSLACFTSMMSQRVCDAMLPELARQFDSTLAAAAQTVSLFALTYGLAQLLCGALGDRYGKWRVLTLATLASAAINLLAALSASLPTLVVARVVAAAFAAAIIPLSLAWTGDAVPYALRQETLARVGLGTTSGIFGGQLVGGLLTDTVGWRWAFVLLTLLFLGVGLLLHASRRDRHASGGPRTAAGSGHSGVGRQVVTLLREEWVRKMLVFGMLQGAAGFGLLAIIATHLHIVHSLPLASSGAVASLMGLGGVIYMGLARRVIGRIGQAGMPRIGGLTMAGALLTVAWSPWWETIVVIMLITGFAFFMLHNTLQALATQMAPHARGLGVAMFATALFMGQALGVLVGTWLTGLWGSAAVISAAAAVLAAVGLTLSAQLHQRLGPDGPT